ncbi:caspase-3-like isoform X4 [Acropora muricata]|uniref:caspase-3-like isoform X4 n=1 Tax=Acropora muricata TaxID=159855 RepID=UPI0034E580D5
MNDEHRQLLRQKREKFLRDLDAKRAASKLYSRGIFSEEDKDEVNAKKTNYQQREEVLDILPRKGPKAFLVFCDILHEISEHLEAELRPVQEEEKCTENTDGSLDKEPLAAARSPTENGDKSDGRLLGRLGGGVPAKPTEDAVDTETIYKMSRAPRGIAIIINNKNFLRSSGMDKYPRNGTDADRDALEKLFKSLKFEVRIYNDITKYQIRGIAKEMAALDHSDYDAFIFSILTHGEEGLLYGTDGIISTRDLTSTFKDATTLAGKPKMFFFQACQGYEYMDGMDVPDGPQASSKVSVPSEADFLYAYSTVPGYYSWRNSVNSSWFIQSLTEVFEENAERMDILRMLTRVNARVSTFKSRTGEYYSDSKRQVSSIVSMLRKELYFFPEEVTEQN